MAALNTLLLLLAALAIPGLINRTRALLAGRKGIRFAQHLYDVRLLLRKGAVYSPTTTAVFRAAPSVTLGPRRRAVRPRGRPAVRAVVRRRPDRLRLPPGSGPRGPHPRGDGHRKLVRGHGRQPRSPVRRAGRTGADARLRHAGPAVGLHLFRRDLLGRRRERRAAGRGAAAGGLRAREDRLHRGRARPGRRPPHAPRTDDDPRSDVPRLLRRRPGLYQDGRMAQDRRAVESTQARNKLARNTTFILTVAALAVLVFFTGYLLQLNIGLQ